jgi:hypothetical protein
MATKLWVFRLVLRELTVPADITSGLHPITLFVSHLFRPTGAVAR